MCLKNHETINETRSISQQLTSFTMQRPLEIGFDKQTLANKRAPQSPSDLGCCLFYTKHSIDLLLFWIQKKDKCISLVKKIIPLDFSC